MRTLRIVVVDDEAPARQILREYLASIPNTLVVAECANGFEAVKAVSEHVPDLLILDVQMPKLDGFEVLELVGTDVAVIFATAYDEFALRAFDVHAVDYLLKPFGEARLREAIESARHRLDQALPPAPPTHLVRDSRPPNTWLTRVVIKDGTNVHVIPVDRVDYVEAQDDYVSVHAGGRSYLKEQTLTELEQQMDPRRFIRIHRSYVLNLDRLARLERESKDSRVAILRDERTLPVSRSGYARLKALL
jgi:two-component system, LytTR family, response regulator